MAQAFVTTYKNDFRWNTQPRVQPINPDAAPKFELSGDIWLLNTGTYDDEESNNLANAEAAIHKMLMKRMRTTYQRAFCKQQAEDLSITKSKVWDNSKVDTSVVPEQIKCLENELLEQSKRVYEKIPNKVLPPLETARDVFGCIRPTRLRVPLSMYQNEYGRVAYNILKRSSEKTNNCVV